ncbi:MAG TPA: TylF/MycF/NovP-related O-methyltransferase [Acetobacteraceae bacterium]
MNMHPLPRAIAVQYPEGELIFPSGVKPMWLDYSYDAMGLRTFGKSTEFLRDERFIRAHARGWACAGRKRRHIDDIRWNMHVALWAASQAARLPGDFVECGVDNGMLSVGICEWLDFNRTDRDFWLFDTFDGIPESQMSEAERAGIGSWHNRESYEECFEAARANFAPWPRCRLVRGEVPDTLAAFPADRKVAFLSIDMNILLPEIAALDFFWDRLVPGGIVLLDDYGWMSHTDQRAGFDAFARAQGTLVLTLPTGQGLMIR